MKKKKWLLILFVIIAVSLIIGGLAFAFSLSDDKEDNKGKDKGNDKQDEVKVDVKAGKYGDADFVCKKLIRDVEVYTMYDVIYVYLKGDKVKKANLVNLMACKSKETFDEQRKNDDKVFERTYDEDKLTISYEYADEQIFITEEDLVHVDKTGVAYKSELEKKDYVCE